MKESHTNRQMSFKWGIPIKLVHLNKPPANEFYRFKQILRKLFYKGVYQVIPDTENGFREWFSKLLSND